MTTSSVTRSIEIHAPVEEVFAFVSDPRRRNEAVERAFKRRIVVTDVQTSPEGVITGWKGTMRILLPGTTWVIPFDIPGSTERSGQERPSRSSRSTKRVRAQSSASAG